MNNLKTLTILLVSALVSASGCSKTGFDTQITHKETKITITVNACDTKTSNNGVKTVWEEGDSISVFVNRTGNKTYGKNCKFIIKDVEKGLFEGTVPETLDINSTYDWYAVYPFDPSATAPNNTAGAYYPVGNESPVQQGLDNRAHLAGAKMTTWGTAKSVPGGERPSLTMHQLSSVIAVKVNNTSGSDVEISNVSIISDKNIAGTYYLDISGDSPALTPSGDQYIYNTINLNTFNAVLPSGLSSKFYVAVTPFTSDCIDIAVNGNRKHFSFGTEIEFQAGHIKTINYNLESGTQIHNISVSEAIDKLNDGNTYYINGIVSNITNLEYGNFDLTEGSKSLKIYGLLTPQGESRQFASLGVKAGDTLTVRGTVTSFGTTTQVQNAAYVSNKPYVKDDSGEHIGTWTRVTSSADVTSGGTFIIGYEESNGSGVIVPMRDATTATTSSEGYILSGTSASSSGNGTIDISTVTDTDDYRISIVPSTVTSGEVCLKIGDKYVGNDDTKNKIKLYESQSSNTSLGVKVGTDGQVTLSITAGSTYKYLQYNTSSPRFAFYNGGQKTFVMFKGGGSTGGDDDEDDNTFVYSLEASSITSSTAVLSASYVNSAQVPYSAYFQYGTSASTLNKDAYCNELLSSTSGNFTANLYNLSPSTKYYYRAVITIGDESWTGEVKSFTTAASSGSSVTTRGWAEMPGIADADNNRIDDNNATYYYAYHSFSSGSTSRRNYSVCFSSEHHCAMWVAAPRHSCYEGSSGRTDAYQADPDIPAGIQFKSKDTDAGCNKGHLLGSAERTCSSAANRQVFYYTNIAPQYSGGYNTGGGGWNILEDYIDTQVCSDTLYAVIGCYYDSYTDGYGYSASPKKISFGGRSDVSCPTMFYYAVLRTKKGNSGKAVWNCTADELQCVAFVRSHNNSLKGQKVSAKEMMSISDLEKLTGFKYFVNVPNAPKSTFNADDWL